MATKAWSIGRESFGNPNRKPLKIGNGTYYWSYLSTSFASGTTRIRTLVMMDKNNKYMEFAVMAACGNPTTGTKPVFQCEMLNYEKSKLNDTDYEFWTNVTAKNGATVKSVVYNFGDGSPTVPKTNPLEKVKHTFKPGNWEVSVTVTYNVNGHTQTETIQEKCKTKIEVKPQPVFVCKSLDGFLIDQTGKRKYGFLTVGHVENGAKLVSAEYNYGDGSAKETKSDVIKINDTDYGIGAEHTYADNLVGEKTITADLKFTIGDDTKNARCETKINLEELPKMIFDCTALDGQLISGTRNYKFTATAMVKNGAKLLSADFNFGDKTSKHSDNVKKVNDTTYTIAVTHLYSKKLFGKVKIVADLKFNIGETTDHVKCATSLNFKKKTCEELNNCRGVLPSTGPVDGLLGAVGFGSFAGAGLYYHRARRSLLRAIFKR